MAYNGLVIEQLIKNHLDRIKSVPPIFCENVKHLEPKIKL